MTLELNRRRALLAGAAVAAAAGPAAAAAARDVDPDHVGRGSRDDGRVAGADGCVRGAASRGRARARLIGRPEGEVNAGEAQTRP